MNRDFSDLRLDLAGGGKAGEADPILAQPEDERHFHYVTMTTFGFFLLFAASTITCVTLGMDPDVNYWLSRVGWFGWFGQLAWAVPVLLVAQHVIHIRMGSPKRWLVMLCVLGGSVFFAFQGGKHRHKLSLAATRLYDDDCFTFQQKANLQEAYQTALGHYHACNARLAQEGQPPVPTVETCLEYEKAEANADEDLRGRWAYLAHVEEMYTCAAFCEGGKTLWARSPDAFMPPCSRFVSMKLFTKSTQAAFVLWYSVATMVLFFPAQIFIGPIFHRFYRGARHGKR